MYVCSLNTVASENRKGNQEPGVQGCGRGEALHHPEEGDVGRPWVAPGTGTPLSGTHSDVRKMASLSERTNRISCLWETPVVHSV